MTLYAVFRWDKIVDGPSFMERYLTVEQAAALLQVHPDTVRHWLRTQQLRGRKIGRIWRIAEAEVHALAQPQTPASTTSTP